MLNTSMPFMGSKVYIPKSLEKRMSVQRLAKIVTKTNDVDTLTFKELNPSQKTGVKDLLMEIKGNDGSIVNKILSGAQRTHSAIVNFVKMEAQYKKALLEMK